MIREPARRMDVAQVFAAAHPGGAPAYVHDAVFTAWRSGAAWVWRVRPGGPPLAVAGIVHSGDTLRIWFVPGADATQSTVPLVRAFRVWLDTLQGVFACDATTEVASINRPGQRLNYAVGFRRESVGPVELWRRSLG